jgi:hypothetical protein
VGQKLEIKMPPPVEKQSQQKIKAFMARKASSETPPMRKAVA